MFEILLLDLDDTILDFHLAERYAIQKTLAAFGIEPNEEVCGIYSRINREHWQRLERRELTREQVRVGRFDELFRTLGVGGDPLACADAYVENLGQGHYFLPGAQEAVGRLSQKYRLFLVTNGNASVQEGRLKSAKITHYFEKVFISQLIGANKPAVEFFNGCFAQIPDFDREKTLIVGDSLTSDILGGNNAGIATCWVNPGHLPHGGEIRVDYQIEALSQLEALLETLR